MAVDFLSIKRRRKIWGYEINTEFKLHSSLLERT